METKRPHRVHIDLLSGKVYGALGEFWFKYIGYCLVVAAVYSAAALGNSPVLTAVKWMSMLALYGWLNRQIERFFVYIWPETEPEWGYRPKKWQLIVTNTVGLPFVVLAYAFGIKVAEVIIQLKA